MCTITHTVENKMEYKFMATVRKIGVTTKGISIPNAVIKKGVQAGKTYQFTITTTEKEKNL